MRKGLFATLLAAIACGIWYPVLRGMAAADAPVLADVVLVAMAVVVVLAVCAVALALRATSHMLHLRADVEQSARSLDACLREFSLMSDRDAVSREALASFVQHELALISARTASQTRAAIDDAPSPKAVSSDKPQQAPTVAVPAVIPDADVPMIPEKADAVAFTGSPPALTLRPIVSASDDGIVGFEAMVRLDRPNHPDILVDRLPAWTADLSRAAFERWVIEGVLALNGDSAEDRQPPVHVRIAALLMDETELANALNMVRRQHNPAGRRIVVSVPAAALLREGAATPALRQFLRSGLEVAAEGWPGTANTLSTLRLRGVSVLKVSARNLLGRTKGSVASGPLPRFVQVAAAANMTLTATDVTTPADAAALVKRGVDSLCGPYFTSWKVSDETSFDREGEAELVS